MARPHPALIELAAGRPLPPVVDAPELLWSAVEHRVYGLLWSAVQRGEVALPDAENADLARWYLRSVARNKMLWETLDEVIERLDQLDVTVAVAKGVVAERRWYERLGDRPTSDLDLVISPDDFSRIAEVVRAFEPQHRMVDELPELAERGWLQVIDVMTEWGVYIDLHFDLLKLDVPSRHRIQIFDRAVPEQTPQGTTIKTIDPETSLIHLLLHVNKDRFSHLLALVDICRILEQEDIDWDYVDRFLAEEGFLTHGYRALRVVATELDIELPVPRWPADDWRGRAWDRLWPPSVRLGGQIGWLENQRRQFVMPLIAPGRFWSGLASLRRRALPPPALLRYHHPDGAGSYARWLVSSRVEKARERRELRRDERSNSVAIE